MNAGRFLFLRVLDHRGSGDSTFAVPFSYLPVVGFFNESGIFCVDYIEMPFTRNELWHVQEEEEFTNDPFVPQENETCIVMIQIVSLEETLRVTNHKRFVSVMGKRVPRPFVWVVNS